MKFQLLMLRFLLIILYILKHDKKMSILDIVKKKDPYGMESFSNFVSDDFYRVYKYDVMIMLGEPKFECKWIANTRSPSSTTSIQYINWMHSRIPIPGKTFANQWGVSIRDTADGGAYKYFNDWRNDVYNVTKPSFAGIRESKRLVHISLHPPHGLAGDPRGYVLYGVFPFQIGEISLSPEDNNISIFNVDLVMDYFESFIGNEELRRMLMDAARG